ncbi:MAG TPA: phosphatase PAP2 family protein [Actinomycetales bacterium]|jgi:undecaprenyl-diphosphatase
MTALVEPGAPRRRTPQAWDDGPDDGSLPPWRLLARVLATRVLPVVVAWFVLLATVGWLLGHPLKEAIEPEDAVNRWFAAYRTDGWDTVTRVVSLMADTGTIVLTMLAAVLTYRLVAHRVREAVPLVVGVCSQALCFFSVTLLVDRERPQVTRLDESPPTSSFPSGHTGAASALYVGMVILCLRRFRSPWVRLAIGLLLGLVPLAVAVSRVYRGMHHPSDVVFGLLNGLVCALVAHLVLTSATGRYVGGRR